MRICAYVHTWAQERNELADASVLLDGVLIVSRGVRECRDRTYACMYVCTYACMYVC